MVPVDYVDTTATLHIAFAEGIDYSALYGIEQMLGCHIEPCMAVPSFIRPLLQTLSAHRGETEVVFDHLADNAEFSRIIRSYCLRLFASEIRMAACGPYLWVRLLRPSRPPVDLLLRSRHDASTHPSIPIASAALPLPKVSVSVCRCELRRVTRLRNIKPHCLREDQRDMDNICALIVDDSSVMRKIVERSLRQAGLSISQVLEAGNGAEALAAVQKNKVDLILCDINMPVMDGLEFVKRLSGVENAKGIPVVMITTEGSEGHVVQALSAGARGYIRKPFTPDQVKEHVLPVLEAK